MNDPLFGTRCLATTDAIVIDGANGVCDAPRTGAWPAAAVLAADLGVVVAVALWAAWVLPRERPTARGRRVWALCAAMLLAAGPGWAALLGARADAPGASGHTANDVRALLDAVTTFAAKQSRPLAIELAAGAPCVACEPVAWMAAPRSVPAGEVHVVLGAGAFGGLCRETTPPALVCGPAL